MTEPKEALKPCPFCGGEAVLGELPAITFRPDDDGSDPSTWFVYCSKCEGGLPPGYVREEAIAAWNTRADATENAALREKLAEIRDVADIGSDAHKLAVAALTGGDNAEG